MEKDLTTYKNQFNRDNYDQIMIMTPKGTKAIWKEEAKARSESMSQFIQNAVQHYIKNCPTDELPSNTKETK